MAVSDSVSVFAEGTFAEQIRELVDYLARGLPEGERTSESQPFLPFQDVLAPGKGQKSIEDHEDARRTALIMVLTQVKGLGDGTEKEVEGFFNLLFSHFLTLLPLDAPETKEQLVTLLQTIATSPEQTTFTKYRILSNMFNAIPRKSNLRHPIYKTLLEIASSHDELEQLALSRVTVENWLQEWDVSPQEKSEFLKQLSDISAKSGQAEASYEYTLSYVRSLPSPSPAAQIAAVDAIASALRLPSMFDLDPLFRIDAVVSAKDHELFSLLHIFLNEGLSEYKAWEDSHPDVFVKYDLDKTQLERKIRLLSLATLGFQNTGCDLPYSTIASALQVDSSQVERWVIDVIRAGLLSGRLSQTTQTLHITRATSRTFERPQWEMLEKRLVAWKAGLASVLEVVAAARTKGGAEAVTVSTSASASASGPAGVETPVAAAPQAAVTA